MMDTSFTRSTLVFVLMNNGNKLPIEGAEWITWAARSNIGNGRGRNLTESVECYYSCERSSFMQAYDTCLLN